MFLILHVKSVKFIEMGENFINDFLMHSKSENAKEANEILMLSKRRS